MAYLEHSWNIFEPVAQTGWRTRFKPESEKKVGKLDVVVVARRPNYML
jgi:hypothetical protein